MLRTPTYIDAPRHCQAFAISIWASPTQSILHEEILTPPRRPFGPPSSSASQLSPILPVSPMAAFQHPNCPVGNGRVSATHVRPETTRRISPIRGQFILVDHWPQAVQLSGAYKWLDALEDIQPVR